jgi:hypothetical protein
MEEQRRVNLSQFRTPKKSKRFLVKFALYALVLGILAFLIITRTRKQPLRMDKQEEIHGVSIEQP